MLGFKKQRSCIGIFFKNKVDYENFLGMNLDIYTDITLESLPNDKGKMTAPWAWCIFVFVTETDIKNINERARKGGYRLSVLNKLNVSNYYGFEQY